MRQPHNRWSLVAAIAAVLTFCLVLWSWRPATDQQLKIALQEWACVGTKSRGSPSAEPLNGSAAATAKKHSYERVTVLQKLPAKTVVQTVEAPAVTVTAVSPQESKDCSASIAREILPFPDFNMTIYLPPDPKFDPAGPRPEQVVILTASDGKGHQVQIPDLVARVTENRQAYCDHHGYTCLFLDLNSYDLGNAQGVWKKLPAIAEAFNSHPEAQWVFWLDMDAIIMDPKRELHKDFLSEEGMNTWFEIGVEYHRAQESLGFRSPDKVVHADVDMIIAQDYNGLNAGAFFLRRTDWTQWLLDMWSDPFFVQAEWWGQEQEVLQHFVKHHPTVRSHVGIAKQHAFNAYAWENEQGEHQWSDDYFLIHFAGCWVQDACQRSFDDYWNMRKTLD